MSVGDRGDGRDACARRDPLLVGLELHPKPLVEDPQVAIATAHDRVWHDGLHLLRHEADIGLVAAVVTEAIEAEAVVEPAEQRDVVLERYVGAPAATATPAPAAAATTPEAAAAAAAAADAPATARAAAGPGDPAAAAATATAGEALVTAGRLRAG